MKKLKAWVKRNTCKTAAIVVVVLYIAAILSIANGVSLISAHHEPRRVAPVVMPAHPKIEVPTTESMVKVSLPPPPEKRAPKAKSKPSKRDKKARAQ